MIREDLGLSLKVLDSNQKAVFVPLLSQPAFQRPDVPLKARTVFAAAHVIPKTLGENIPGAPAELDWEATLNYRRHLWSWGLGVADAMDTAQRNMGLDATATRELIGRSAEVAQDVGGLLAAGVNTDAREEADLTLSNIVKAYLEQLAFCEESGVVPVLMASRHLARTARDASDYRKVYDSLLETVQTPVVLHWLGEAFDPELRGYFGAVEWEKAADTLIDIIEKNPEKVSGVKMSLLDADAERAVRRRLPQGVSMFTGDDFNYVELIAEDTTGDYSDALLGAFSVLAPNASAAIQALDAGNPEEYRTILDPTQQLARQVFASPTFYYKTGVAFLSWLNGHQEAFQMVGGLHAARSVPHLSRIVELANAAGALERPELARRRWHSFLEINGIGEGA